MHHITIGVGVILVALGLFGYFGSASDSPSPTALIPAGFGAVLIVLGIVAHKPGVRKHAMHAAAAVGLAAAGVGIVLMRGVSLCEALFGGLRIRPAWRPPIVVQVGARPSMWVAGATNEPARHRRALGAADAMAASLLYGDAPLSTFHHPHRQSGAFEWK